MGKVRIANVLSRAALHISPSTVARVLQSLPRPPSPTKEPAPAERTVKVTRAGYAPSCTITDQGVQFGTAFRTWCARHNVRPRFGAVGRYGSIAVVERFMRTLESEGLRRVVVPLRLDAMRACLSRCITWYNEVRPHQSLRGATPSELYHGSIGTPRRLLVPHPRFRLGGASSSCESKCKDSTAHSICRSSSFATLLEQLSVRFASWG